MERDKIRADTFRTQKRLPMRWDKPKQPPKILKVGINLNFKKMKKKITLIAAALLVSISAALACSGSYYACSMSDLLAYNSDLQANCPSGSSITILSCTDEPSVIAIMVAQ